MNAWALNKVIAIKMLMLVLEERYGPDALVMSRHWEDDTKAVGLCRLGEEGLLAYVYTYGEAQGKYGVHLEYPGITASSATSSENLDLQHLIELLAIHFDLVAR